MDTGPTIIPQPSAFMRLRGTITAFEGNVLSVKTRDGKDLKVELADRSVVATVKAVKLSDIKAGDGVGATTKPGPDGTLTAPGRHGRPGRPVRAQAR